MPDLTLVDFEAPTIDADRPHTCPYCCSTRVEAPYEGHPSGWGMIQVGPHHCFDCDAVEMSPYREYPEATPEELQKQWLRGDV